MCIRDSTKFGLMQITRQRVRPVAVEEVSDVCPTCNGTGKIEPTAVSYTHLDVYKRQVALRPDHAAAAFDLGDLPDLSGGLLRAGHLFDSQFPGLSLIHISNLLQPASDTRAAAQKSGLRIFFMALRC